MITLRVLAVVGLLATAILTVLTVLGVHAAVEGIRRLRSGTPSGSRLFPGRSMDARHRLP